MKKIITATISLAMLLSLTACSEDTSSLGTVEKITTAATEKTTESAVPETAEQPQDGEYDAGEISVNVPDGWKVFPVYKTLEGQSDVASTSAFRISKGAEVENDLNTTPFIEISFSPKGVEMSKFTKEIYGDGEDVGPVTTGELTWNGFEVMMDTNMKLIILYTEDAEGNQYQAAVWAELIGGKISLEDSDVIEILSSVRASE